MAKESGHNLRSFWVEENTMKKEEDLLGSKEVAHILDMGPDEVIELARKGELKATKPGRFWKFRSRDAMAYKRKLEKEQMATRLSPVAQ
jgi:excisionase family DNA binding protein